MATFDVTIKVNTHSFKMLACSCFTPFIHEKAATCLSFSPAEHYTNAAASVSPDSLIHVLIVYMQ